MIETPKENKKRAATRVIAEALAQALPVTAGLAQLYRFTHPAEMELAVAVWREEVTAAVNDLEARAQVIEARIAPRLTIGEAALALALWLTKETEPWPPRLVMWETMAGVFPDISKPELEEACAELEHRGLVKTSATMWYAIRYVQACPDLYWAFDPVVVGTDPTIDARELASRILAEPALAVVAKLDEALGWPKRRLNPALARLIPFVGPKRISRTMQARYYTEQFLLIPEDRFRLRSFAQGAELA
jgi:hypothetical protein